jgi:hypothetical protein
MPCRGLRLDQYSTRRRLTCARVLGKVIGNFRQIANACPSSASADHPTAFAVSTSAGRSSRPDDHRHGPFRYPHYHRPSDTPDKDFQSWPLLHLIKLAVRVLGEDNAEQP